MVPDDHEICASTDHRHWQFSVHWCPHRQQWSLGRSAWTELGTADDPTEYVVESAFLGPFDGASEVRRTIRAWIDATSFDDLDVPPRLPG